MRPLLNTIEDTQTVMRDPKIMRWSGISRKLKNLSRMQQRIWKEWYSEEEGMFDYETGKLSGLKDPRNNITKRHRGEAREYLGRGKKGCHKENWRQMCAVCYADYFGHDSPLIERNHLQESFRWEDLKACKVLEFLPPVNIWKQQEPPLDHTQPGAAIEHLIMASLVMFIDTEVSRYLVYEDGQFVWEIPE